MDLLYYLTEIAIFLYSLFVLLTGVMLVLVGMYPNTLKIPPLPLWKILILSLIFPLTWKWVRDSMK